MGNGGNLPSTRKFASMMNDRLEDKRDSLAKMIPEHMDPDRFIDVARTAIVTGGDELRKCDLDSVYMALRQCAAAGLLPDGDESAIIRYGSEAQWTPMVKGVIRQILRSPGVERVETRVVRKGDHFEYRYGLNPDLEHRADGAAPSREDYDPTVEAAYAVVFYEDRAPQFEVMHRAEIEQARKSSRAPDSPAWRNWYSEMARKTVLHRVSKYVDLAPAARRLMQADVAAGWDGEAPLPEGGTMEDKLAASAESDVADVKRKLAGAEPEEASESEPAETESREESAETSEELGLTTEPAEDEGEEEEPEPEPEGRRIYPDDEDAPEDLPGGTGLWIDTPGSGWYRPFVIADAPGGVIEQKPPEDAFLTPRNVREAEAIRKAREYAGVDAEEAPTQDEGPEEPTEEEKEQAAEVQAEQYRAILKTAIESEDHPVTGQIVKDAVDKLYGGSDEVERTEAGFVDVGRLDADRLSRLVDEVLDVTNAEAPDVG